MSGVVTGSGEKRIRLAVVSESMNVGGGEMMAARLAAYVDPSKFDLKFFVISEERDNQIKAFLDESGISYECLGLPTSFSFKGYSKFSRALKAFSPDVVHEHLDSAYSWIWSLLHRRPLAATLHSDPFRRKNKKVDLLIKTCETFGRIKVVGCSKKTAELAKKCYRLKEKNVACVYNPVDTALYAPADQNRDFVDFVHVGRFHEVKNHALLVEAFAEVASVRPNCALTLAGDGPLFEDIKKKVSDLGLNDRVHILGNVRDISGLLSGMSVFVLPSRSEACPVVVLEAMASGLPIVASCVGGVPELVDGNGILIEPNDRQALCGAMISLIDDKEKRIAFADASRKRAALFDKKVIAQNYQEVYRALVKR